MILGGALFSIVIVKVFVKEFPLGISLEGGFGLYGILYLVTSFLLNGFRTV